VTHGPAGPARWVVLWEFSVRDGEERRFEQLYGPAGAWVRLFQRVPGHVRTELWRDPARPGRYVTADYWTAAEVYYEFLSEFAAEYAELDARCEGLTERETHLGSFDVLDRPSVFPHDLRTLDA
jgi:hypothetical protein